MADPRTCLHNVIAITSFLRRSFPVIYCVSCDTIITEEIWKYKNYRYDTGNHAWVHQPGK